MNELEIQNEIITSIEDRLSDEKERLEENATERNKSYNHMQKDVKNAKLLTFIFGCLYLILPMTINGTILQGSIYMLGVTSFGLSLSQIVMYFYDKKSFKQNNNMALSNSKMIDILSKKLEEEKSKSNQKQVVGRTLSYEDKLNELKKFVLLAKEYSNGSEVYKDVYNHEPRSGFFHSETEEAMFIEKFIVDDIKREEEFDEELKVLSKVK